jgi:hypothetical protein
MGLQSSVAGLHGNPLEGATAASLGHKTITDYTGGGQIFKIGPAEGGLNQGVGITAVTWLE